MQNGMNMVGHLTRGANIAIRLPRILVGIDWQTPNVGLHPYDLDVSAFLVNAQGRVADERNFVFYNNQQSLCGNVTLSGDNQTGENGGEVYDEALILFLANLGPDIERVVIVLSIHRGSALGQKFGDLDNAFLYLVDPSDGQEIATFAIGEDDLDTETAMIFGEFYRRDGGWKFRAVGQGRSEGYEALVSREFGLDLADDSQLSQSGPEAPQLVPVPPQGLHLPNGPVGFTGPGAPSNSAFPEPVQLSGLTQSFGVQPVPQAQMPNQPQLDFAPVLQMPNQPPINYMNAVDPSLLRRGSFDVDDSIVPMPMGDTMEFSFHWRKASKDFGLIALVTYRDGRKVAYDWSHLGGAHEEVWHHGDARRGGSREYITVQLRHGSQIDCIALVGYSEVDNGLGSFKGSGCYCTIDNGQGDVAHFKLKKRNPFVFHVVFGVVVFGVQGQMFLRRDARYSKFGSERRPLLEPAGHVIMNAGPVKFKRR